MDIVVDIVDNHFNPRLREGGDFSSLSSVDGETISIHASAKEATMVGCIYRHFKGISIHASAKEATVYNGTIDWKKVKFQSTPPRRRRPDFLFFLHGHDYFNPRLREGGDGNSCTWSTFQKRFQSTPPRRRRQDTVCCTVETPTDFNPRLREGGDAHFQR